MLASNLADALQQLGVLSAGWPFASGNYSLLAEALSLYALSSAWAALVFALVLLLEVAVVGLFWRAAWAPATPIAQPFLPAFALIGGFLVADEVLLVYRRFPNLETAHFTILCALLLSLAVLHLLERDTERP